MLVVGEWWVGNGSKPVSVGSERTRLCRTSHAAGIIQDMRFVITGLWRRISSFLSAEAPNTLDKIDKEGCGVEEAFAISIRVGWLSEITHHLDLRE